MISNSHQREGEGVSGNKHLTSGGKEGGDVVL